MADPRKPDLSEHERESGPLDDMLGQLFNTKRVARKADNHDKDGSEA